VDGDEEEDRFMYEIFEKIHLEMRNEEEGTMYYFPSYCSLLPHRGKRHAMYEGFQYVKRMYPNNSYIIIIDSDTVIEKGAVQALVSAIHRKEEIGCGTGSLRIFNQINLLTRIVNARYAYAFDIERSAMSYFGCMNCCSGPFSIYRQEVLTDELLDSFVNQEYCCVRVGPGDDRHLTNLVMMSGYQSVQTRFAIAWTESPEHFYRFLNQQLRWMRSFYREQIWQIRSIPHQHIYLSLITTYEILFPFFILLGFFQKLLIPVSDTIIIHRAIYGISILSLRTLLLVWFQNGDCSYFLNILYFPLYFFFILPIKIYAMLTCYKMGWITSSRHSILTNSNIETTIITGILMAWFALIIYYIHGFQF
jgi:hyaluronan synthase